MNHLQRIITLAFALVIFSSCDDDETSQVQWGIFEFPGENTVYAIYGDLDDYLLLSTPTKILRTADGGKTWDTVKQIPGDPIGRIYALNNDLYAISNFTDYISHDEGLTWEALSFDHPLDPHGLNFNDSKGILYQIVQHSNGELGLPTSFLRSVNQGNSWENIFHYKKAFYSWHIDEDDRVYIGTSGAVWDGQFFNDDNPQFRAFLYYMK